MMGCFVELRRSLKVNAGKSKVMVLGGEEGLECEISLKGIRLEYVLKIKYLGCVLDESGTDEAECSRKVASGRRGVGSISSQLMLGICSFSVLESCMIHCLHLFLSIEREREI